MEVVAILQEEAEETAIEETVTTHQETKTEKATATPFLLGQTLTTMLSLGIVEEVIPQEAIPQEEGEVEIVRPLEEEFQEISEMMVKIKAQYLTANLGLQLEMT